MLRRALSLYMLIVLCFMALLVKIVYINRQNYSLVTDNQSMKTLTVGERRGSIYDRNFKSLTCAEKKLVAAVTPVISSAEYLREYMSKEDIEEKISKGFPFLVSVNEKINNDYIRTFEVPVRYSESSIAPHITGYVNSDGNGVSGIEKAYNEYLKKNSGSLTVSFSVDALGRVLAGMEKRITDNDFSSKAGVVLSIDSRIQKITQDALKGSRIESGAALVMECGSGELLAVASIPDFNADDIASCLSEDNSPLVNKAFCSYSVGSVFKSIVAAAALEEGIPSSFSYECKGEMRVGDTVFRCYSEKSHGKTDMISALENSCNTYFINLMQQLDTERLLSLCRRLGFSESDTLAKGMATATGVLPDTETLRSKGNLANFSFGQGELSATPLQILKAYHALATGEVVSPVLVRGLTDSRGLMSSITDQKEKQVVFSENTVVQIRRMLKSVVEKGIASNAKSDIVSLAGKTGTAESGIYENNREILRTWFAGFFPSHNPSYVVVVINEDGIAGNSDCAPVFREICEKIVTER